MKAKIVEKFICPICSRVRDTYDAAYECCEKIIESTYACSGCDATFFKRKDAEYHLPEHLTNADGLLPHQVYLDALLNGQPPLGQWVTEMEAETEFLIP